MSRLDTLAQPRRRSTVTADTGAMRGRIASRSAAGTFVILEAHGDRITFGPCAGTLAATAPLDAPVLVLFADDDRSDPWVVAHG